MPSAGPTRPTSAASQPVSPSMPPHTPTLDTAPSPGRHDGSGLSESVNGFAGSHAEGPEMGHAATVRCARCSAKDWACVVRPGCRACDRCGRMKTRCSLSDQVVSLLRDSRRLHHKGLEQA